MTENKKTVLNPGDPDFSPGEHLVWSLAQQAEEQDGQGEISRRANVVCCSESV